MGGCGGCCDEEVFSRLDGRINELWNKISELKSTVLGEPPAGIGIYGRVYGAWTRIDGMFFSGDYNDLINKPAPVTNLITSDIPVSLNTGDTLGKYRNGDLIPSAGWTFEQLMNDIAQDYVTPTITSFKAGANSLTTYEVGFSLTAVSIPFSWNLTQNSGQITTVDIQDITAGTNIATGISSTSPQNAMINPIQLGELGDTQVWRLKGNNTLGADVFSANDVTVQVRYLRFYGATSVALTNPADGVVGRGYGLSLGTNEYHMNNSFTLSTGTTETKMVVILPPGVTITNVTDTTNLNANLTNDYILSTMLVRDYGGVDRTYNMYTLTLSGAYSTSANHVITTT